MFESLFGRNKDAVRNGSRPKGSMKPAFEALERRELMNVAPVITPPSSPYSYEGASGPLLQIVATDGDSDPLTYAAVGLPPGLTIDSSGMIGGKIHYTAASLGGSTTYAPVVTVFDGVTHTSANFNWVVSDVPLFGWGSYWYGNEGQSVSLELAPTAAVSGANYTASNLPSWLTLNPATGLLSGWMQHVPNNPSDGGMYSTPTTTLSISVTAAVSGAGSDTLVVPMAVTDFNRLPYGSWRVYNEGAPISWSLAANNSLGNTLAYSATGLPSGVTIDAATGLVGGSADYTAASAGTTVQYTATVTVSDQWGAIDKQTIWLSVSDAPLVQNQYLGVSEGSSISIYAGPSTAPSGIVYSTSGLPAGLALNTATGLITGRPQHQINNPSPGGWTASTATVTANYGAITDVGTIVWTVSDVNRLPTQASAYSYAEGQAVSIPFAATDLTGSSLTYTATGLPSGLSIDSATGLISGTVNFNAVTYGTGYPSATVTLTDNRGATDFRSVNWSISDVPLFGWGSYWYGNEGQSVSLELAPTAAVSGANYTASNLPSWLTLNPATGLLSGWMQHVPNNPSDGGMYSTPTTTLSISVTAAVSGAGSDTLVVPMAVTDFNRLPYGSWGAYYEGAPVSWSMAASNALGNTLAYSATGLPTGVSIDAATGLISGHPFFTNAADGSSASFGVTVRVQDNWGATDLQTYWFMISDAPLFADVRTFFGAERESVSFSPFSGSVSYGLTYSATGLPSGISLDTYSGVLFGNIGPDAATSGSSPATIQSTINSSNGGRALVEWIIEDRGRLPDLGSLKNSEGQSVSVWAGATSGSGSLSYSAQGLPDGVSINPSSGLIYGTPSFSITDPEEPRWYYPTIHLNDGAGSEDTVFAWEIKDANRITSIASRTDAEGSSVSFQVHTSPSASMTFSATGLPPGISLNPSTGWLSGAIRFDAAAPGSMEDYFPTITADDGLGGIDSRSFAWTTSSTPLISAGPAYVANAGNYVSLNARNPSVSLSIAYAAQDLPPGLSINPSTGVISGTLSPLYTLVEEYFPIVEASFGSYSETFQFEFDVLPGFTLHLLDQFSGLDQAVSLGLGSNYPVSAGLTYSASGLPSGLSIDASTGLIAGTIASTAAAANDIGYYRPTITVVDSVDGMLETTFAWNVAGVPSMNLFGAWAGPEGASISLHVQSPWGTLAPTYTASGLPAGLTLVPSTGNITGSIAYSNVASNEESALELFSTITVEYGASSTTGLIAWTISDVNRLGGPEGIINSPGEKVSADFAYFGSASFTYSAHGLPDGLSINPSTGTVFGTIAFDPSFASQYKEFTPTITLADAEGGVDQTTLAWTIDEYGSASLGRGNSEGNVVSESFAAMFAGASLTYSASGLPAGLSIDPSNGIVYGTIPFQAVNASDGGSKQFDATLSAMQGSSTQTLSITWLVYNTSRLSSFRDQFTDEGKSISLSHSIAFSGLTFSASNLPTGLTINPSSGLIYGNIAYGLTSPAEVMEYNATIRASDSSGGTDETQMIWSIWDADAFDSVSLVTSNEGATVSMHFTEHHAGGATYSATGLPTGLSINPTTGLVYGTLAYDITDYGVSAAFFPEIRMDVGEDFLEYLRFEWDIVDRSLIGNITNRWDYGGQSVSFSIPTNQWGLTFSASGLPSGLAINPSTGVIAGTLSFPGESQRAYAPMVYVLGPDGASDSRAFAWTVDGGLRNAWFAREGESVTIRPFSGNTYTGLTYSATSLPAGLSIDSATGIIDGWVSYQNVLASESGLKPLDSTITVIEGSESQTHTLHWLVENSSRLTYVDDQFGTELDVVDVSVGFTNPHSQSLTFTASGLPSGITIDQYGVLSGTLSLGAAGPEETSLYAATISVSDPDGAVDSITFLWQVDQIDLLKPIWYWAEAEGNSVWFDAGNGNVTAGVTYTAAGLPPGLTINADTGYISGEISYSAVTSGGVSDYFATIVADDGYAQDTITMRWAIDDTNRLDVADDQFDSEGDTVSWSVSAFAPGLTYSASGLPSGVSINPSTGAIAGTISFGDNAFGDVGLYTPTIFATDSVGAQDSIGFNWEISAPNRIEPRDTIILFEGDSVSVAIAANTQGLSGVSYSASNLPAGVSLNTSTGALSGSISASVVPSGETQAITYSTITLSAGSGVIDSIVLEWSVYGIQAGSVGQWHVTEGDSVSIAPDVSSAPASLTYTALGLPAGLTVDPATALITGSTDFDLVNAVEGWSYIDFTIEGRDSSGSLQFTEDGYMLVSNEALILSENRIDSPGASVSFSVRPSAASSGVTYSASNLPTGISISGAGAVSGILTSGGGSGVPRTVTVTASPGSGDPEESEFVWLVSAPATSYAASWTPTATGKAGPTTGAGVAPIKSFWAGWQSPESPFFARNELEAKSRAWDLTPGNTTGDTEVGDEVAGAFGVAETTTWDEFFSASDFAKLRENRERAAEDVAGWMLADLDNDWVELGLPGYEAGDPIGTTVAAKWKTMPGFSWVQANTGWSELYTNEAQTRLAALRNVARPEPLSLSYNTAQQAAFQQVLALNDPSQMAIFLAYFGDNGGANGRQQNRNLNALKWELRERVIPWLRVASLPQIEAWLKSLTPQNQMVLRFALDYEIAGDEAILENLRRGSVPDLRDSAEKAAINFPLCARVYSLLGQVNGGATYGEYATYQSLDTSTAKPVNQGAMAVDLYKLNTGSVAQRIAFLSDATWGLDKWRSKIQYPPEQDAPGTSQGLSSSITDFYLARSVVLSQLTRVQYPSEEAALASLALVVAPRWENGIRHVGHGQVRGPGGDPVITAPFSTRIIYEKYLKGALLGITGGVNREAYDDVLVRDEYFINTMGYGQLKTWKNRSTEDKAHFADYLTPLDRYLLLMSFNLIARTSQSVEIQARIEEMANYIQSRYASQVQGLTVNQRSIIDQLSEEAGIWRIGARNETARIGFNPAQYDAIPNVLKLEMISRSQEPFRRAVAEYKIVYQPYLGPKIDGFIIDAMQALAPMYRTFRRFSVAFDVAITWSHGSLDQTSDLDAIRGVINGDFSQSVGMKPLSYDPAVVAWDAFETYLAIGTGGGSSAGRAAILSGIRRVGMLTAAHLGSSVALSYADSLNLPREWQFLARMGLGLAGGIGGGLAFEGAASGVGRLLRRRLSILEQTESELLKVNESISALSRRTDRTFIDDFQLSQLQSRATELQSGIRDIRLLAPESFRSSEQTARQATRTLAALEAEASTAGTSIIQRYNLRRSQAYRDARSASRNAQVALSEALVDLDRRLVDVAKQMQLPSSIKSLTVFQSSCFTAGTPLLTPDGSKPIEEFRVGDAIVARDEHDVDAATQVCFVEETFCRVSPIITMRVGGKELHTTREHPFYVVSKGWICAAEIESGDALISHDGEMIPVEAVTDTGRVATVYNVRVRDCHTYFVAAPDSNVFVWAHNADYVFEASTGRLFFVNESGARVLVTDASGGARRFADIDEAYRAIASGRSGDYINLNPIASESESLYGRLLHSEALAGRLPGIKAVFGAPESRLRRVRQGDYRFVLSDDIIVAGDLIETAVSDRLAIMSKILKKANQAERIVVNIADITSLSEAIEGGRDALATSNAIQQVIVVHGGNVVANLVK
ncbi:MAG: putative Ig domain-containing protein [Gemmataceae bacterium]|nr:putative Ig domain-containing protein [Gemmataceae bacterium]